MSGRDFGTLLSFGIDNDGVEISGVWLWGGEAGAVDTPGHPRFGLAADGGLRVH